MADSTSLLDRLLDVAVYAPLGLVLRAREEIPKLAAHGRKEATSQTQLARMVGQMAVAQGRRQVGGVLGRVAGGSGATATGTRTAPASAPMSWPRSSPMSSPMSPPVAPGGREVPIRDLDAEDASAAVPAAVPHAVPDLAPATDVVVAPEAQGSGPPDADDLPIPGYDSLSASQVVQRLPGLSAEELEAVRAYEQAGRARKTVLLRVAQLRAAS